jgi:hypothetical protein
MSWLFRSSEGIFPDLVDDETAVEEESEIVETEYTGCAWCGDGDGEGICSDCEARMLAQSAARHAGR